MFHKCHISKFMAIGTAYTLGPGARVLKGVGALYELLCVGWVGKER